jgi:geranylgeranyl pyrophosphate synthase
MIYSLLGPGKRIRPRLVFAASEMVGVPKEAALAAGLALEMIHCFTLIHDDLPCMDNDDFRRGRPSNHKKFGEAIALLAGDSLMSLALDVFLDAEPFIPAPHLIAGLRRFNWAIGPRGVCGGQAAEALLKENSKLEELSLVHAMKTGALFSAALLIPKDFAGIKDDSSPGLAIDLFARELGLAFQIADDLEDAEHEGVKPTSILHYLPKAEAQSSTLRRLQSAMKGLTATWGNKADALIRTAQEVATRLENQS